MSIARWDPFYELNRIEDRMNRMFRRAWRTWPEEQEFLTTSEFAPAADIYEEKNKLIYKMEIPGIKQEDLDIRLDGDRLTVSGERKFEQDEKRENFRRVERQYGSFSRSFELPASADREKVQANFESGVLRIEIPKRAESRGRQIQIGSGAESTGKKTLKAA